MRVLTWNLFHGRALPPARRDLEQHFAQLLASWPWDVALLQEVPPWWTDGLARACSAEHRTVLTSRNFLLPLRRRIARHDPELAKSNGGGANATLTRMPIACHERKRLALRPERRVAQIVRLGDGTLVANYHGSTRVPLAERELSRLCALAVERSRGAPAVVGGDFNLREPHPPAPFEPVASRDVDHVLAVGLQRLGSPQLHDRDASIEGRRHSLSDHPPLEVELS